VLLEYLLVTLGRLADVVDKLAGLRVMLIDMLVLGLTLYGAANMLFHSHHIADILLQRFGTFLCLLCCRLIVRTHKIFSSFSLIPMWHTSTL